MSLLLPACSLWYREVVRFSRQRSRLLGALATPVVFWLLIGSGIGVSFSPPSAPPGMNYLEYFFPGTMMLIVLFTSIFSTISLIEDRREGVLLTFLVAPASRSGLVLGKLLGGSTLALLQGILLLLLAPWMGVPLSLPSVLLVAGVLFLSAFALTGLGFVIAWQTESTQGFHAVMNLVLFPMWLLSGAVFPPSGAAGWITWIMTVNPLTYALGALRHAMYGSNLPQLGIPAAQTCFVVTLIFAVSTLILSLVQAHRRNLGSLG